MYVSLSLIILVKFQLFRSTRIYNTFLYNSQPRDVPQSLGRLCWWCTLVAYSTPSGGLPCSHVWCTVTFQWSRWCTAWGAIGTAATWHSTQTTCIGTDRWADLLARPQCPPSRGGPWGRGWSSFSWIICATFTKELSVDPESIIL